MSVRLDCTSALSSDDGDSGSKKCTRMVAPVLVSVEVWVWRSVDNRSFYFWQDSDFNLVAEKMFSHLVKFYKSCPFNAILRDHTQINCIIDKEHSNSLNFYRSHYFGTGVVVKYSQWSITTASRDVILHSVKTSVKLKAEGYMSQSTSLLNHPLGVH